MTREEIKIGLREEMRLMMRERRSRFLSQGLCAACGKLPHRPNKKSCGRCTKPPKVVYVAAPLGTTVFGVFVDREKAERFGRPIQEVPLQ